jgi:hypothetical protein
MPRPPIDLSDIEDTWTGDCPVTSFLRTELQRKQASQGAAALSAHERILLTACDFWVATATGQLRSYLSDDPLQRLSRELVQESGAIEAYISSYAATLLSNDQLHR